MVATTTIRAQAYQPLSATSLLVTPAAGPAAAAVSLTEGGCTPGALVAISFQGQALGTVKVGQTGEFSTTVTVPTNAKSGPGAIIVAGPGCRQSATFTVQSGVASSNAVAPANHSVYGMTEVVAGLAILGAVLVFAVRRNRRSIGTIPRHRLRGTKGAHWRGAPVRRDPMNAQE